MSLYDCRIFKNAVLFTFTRTMWSARKQANTSGITTDANPAMLSLTKRLLNPRTCPEYRAILSAMSDLYTFAQSNSVPSFFKSGMYLVKRDQIPRFNAEFKETQALLKDVLVPAFQAVYGGNIEAQKAELGSLFNVSDYPVVESLPGLFTIEWNYIQLSVPEGLPEELRASEEAKLKKQFADAETAITTALRTGLMECINELTAKLKPSNGERRIFRNSVFGELVEFIETFKARNILNDTALESLVNKAKDIVAGVTGDDMNATQAVDNLRSNDGARAMVCSALEGITTELCAQIQEAPASRTFNFDE